MAGCQKAMDEWIKRDAEEADELAAKLPDLDFRKRLAECKA